MKNLRKRIYASSNSPQVSIQPESFFLGFYLESCYNLCHAIRFLSAGSGRECECKAGEGAPSLANRWMEQGQWLWHVPESQQPCPRQKQGSSQPRTDRLTGQQAGLKQPESMDQKSDKRGGKKIPQRSLALMGNVPIPPENSQGRGVLGVGWGGSCILQQSLSNSVLSSASPVWEGTAGWEPLLPAQPGRASRPCAWGEKRDAGEGVGDNVPARRGPSPRSRSL